MAKFNKVEITEDWTGFSYIDEKGTDTSAHPILFVIRQAWSRGVDFDDLLGFNSQGDWSFIRDEEDPETNNAMFERALNYFFGSIKR